MGQAIDFEVRLAIQRQHTLDGLSTLAERLFSSPIMGISSQVDSRRSRVLARATHSRPARGAGVLVMVRRDFVPESSCFHCTWGMGLFLIWCRTNAASVFNARSRFLLPSARFCSSP